MTLDGFAGAERIGATIDVLADSLLSRVATHYPAGSLSSGPSTHPAAEALFGLRLSRTGPGRLTVRGLGSVVEASTVTAFAEADAPTAELFGRYGAKELRGLPAEAVTAAQVGLPVVSEAAGAFLRPEFPPAVAWFASDRPVAEPEELATGAGVEVRFVVSPVFHPLVARGSRADRAGHLAEVAEELYAGGGAQERLEWSVLTGLLTQPAAAAGVVFAGLAALEVDGRPSRASLVVSLGRSGRQITELSAELADSRQQAEVWTVLLPAGPAAVLVETRIATVPQLLLPVGQAADEPDAPDNTVSSVVEAFLPLPDGVSVLTLQLGTAHPEDFGLYTTAFAEVLASVQLGWDGTRAALPPQAPAQEQPQAAAAYQPEQPAYQPPAYQPEVQAVVPPQPVAPPPVAPPVPPPAPVAAPAPAAPAPAQQQPAATGLASVEPEEPKGRFVHVPPPDFNPFAPPKPAAAAAPAAAAPAGDEEELKGRFVHVPPPDFNPFGAPPPKASAPAPAAAVPAAAPAAADPFGTVTTNQPADPFGTVTTAQPAAPAAPVAPPRPTTPPRVAAPGPLLDEDGKPRGRFVHVPPADFNPFAPPKRAAAPAAAEQEEDEAPKGRFVHVPPPDFNPFGARPAGSAPAAAAPAPPAPPANNPFG
ncbi:hypothetical protein ACIRBX_37510 [Kitasatospora sp. NPDC096147]|uniref:hypothetical protein n=1 Tax=Kitasatospora sp. NPDC096147 TaxID=3364093 RepID=UPI0037F74D19